MKIPFTNLQVNLVQGTEKPRGFLTEKGTALSALVSHQGIRVAPQDLWQIYRMNADVYGCIREWRQGVGDAGYKLVDPTDVEIEPQRKFFDVVDYVFRNSNGFSTVKSQALRDIGISGNAYFEIVKGVNGMPHSLKRLDPRTMFIVADQHGTIMAYYQRVYNGTPVKFETNEVWHVVFDNDPDNELLGFSPLETALWEARTDIAAAQSNYYFFENDAVPSNMYILDDDLNEDEQKEAIKQINSQFSGAKNRHKSATLSGVKEVKTLSMSQKDMEFVIGRKFNTDKVCSVYGVPKFILGYTESVNYSSGAKLLEKFYRGTLQPLESNLMAAINGQLFEKLSVSEYVRFEFLPQSFGEESTMIASALSELQAGALTLRQYKVKTGQDLTPEDEVEPMLDRHVLHNGASAILLEDVGVDPVVDPNDPGTADAIVNALKTKLLYNDNSNND